jgi:uncharacterized membrane protein YeaQ/YmgE (transglycosylase-associated protein family)
MLAAVDIVQVAGDWADTVLMWIGFGTVVGLVAKAIMPGRDPGGAMATVILGIAGSVIGSGIVALTVSGAHIRCISPLGFVVAMAGAFLLLLMYRVLSGRIFRETGTTDPLKQGHHGHKVVISER